MRTRRMLGAFIFVLLTMFLVMIVFSRYEEKNRRDPSYVDAGLSTGRVEVTPAPGLNVPQVTDTPKRDDNKPNIDIGDWKYILAGPGNNIGTYTPPRTVPIGDTAQYFDERAIDALDAFLQGARDAGFTPYVMTGFRPYSAQEVIYNGRASQIAWPDYPDESDYNEAAKVVARPGESEHQTGLAVDITDKYYSRMDASQMDQGLLTWLADNCARYGFILRYPVSKIAVTGWNEPWHFRYVGTEAAEYIMNNDLCLEQFKALYK